MYQNPRKKTVNFLSHHVLAEPYQILFEQAADGIFITDPRGNCIEANPRVCEMLGYSRKEILGLTMADLVTPQLDMMRAGKVILKERNLLCKDGGYLPVEINARVLSDGNLLGIVRDITERKKTAAALQQRDVLLSQAEEVAQSGTFDWNLTTNTAKWSPGMHRLFEIPVEKFNGDPATVLSVIHADDVELMVHAMQCVIEEKKLVSHVEYRIVPPSGNIRHIWAQGSLILDESGEVVRMIGVCQDITERKRAEEEIRHLNQELEQRVKERTSQLEAANKELEAFAYSVSHDLRAPLRSIDGFSQMLFDEFRDKLDAQGTDYLNRVRSAAKRMGQLIEDMLNLSRISRQEMNILPVNLSGLAHDIAADLQTSNPDRKAEFTIQEGINVQGDSRFLRIVLENLIGNAWKFTSHRLIAHIEFGRQQQDGNDVYFIKDDGAGFEMKYADKLFGAFQRLHSADEFSGTGIGLAIVGRIIHRHGGDVWAEAELEKGATFYFSLSQIIKDT